MRTCSECGANLGDNDNFCPVCGAKAPEAAPAPTLSDTLNGLTGQTPGPVQEPSAPAAAAPEAAALDPAAPEGEKPIQGRGKIAPKHLGMIAAGLVAVLAIALIGWLVSGLFQGPDRRFVSYHEKMFASMADKELGSAVSNMDKLTSFSTDMTITAQVKGDDLDEDYQQANELLNDSALVLKVDLSKTSAKLGGELILQGNSAFAGTALYDKGTLGFQVPQVSETYYTTDLTELVENLTGQRVEGLDSIELPQVPEKELKKVAKTYMDILSQAVTQESVTSQADAFRLERLPGRRVEGTAYLYQPMAQDVEDMLYDLADQVEKDEDLRALVSKFLGGNVTWINALLAENGDDLDTILDEGLERWAENLRDNAAYYAQELEDSGFTWTLWVGKGGVYKGEVAVNEDSSLCYERTENGFALWTEWDGEADQELLTLEYDKDSNGLYSGSYTTGNGYQTTTLEFDNVDTGKKSALGYYYGDYIIRQTYSYYDDYSNEYSFRVAKGKTGGTDHTMDIGGVIYGSSGPRLELTLNTSDKKSTVATPKGPQENISAYSEEELEQLFDHLGEELTRDFEELEDIFDLEDRGTHPGPELLLSR